MPLRIRRVGVVPARLQLRERECVFGPVAVDLVRRHVDERRLGAGLARGLEQVQRADGVHVEVVERDGRGAIVRRLGRGVDDRRRAAAPHQRQDACAVADVELVMAEAGQRRLRGAADSSACRPAGRRTPRAGCCRCRARQSPARRSTCRPPSRSGRTIRSPELIALPRSSSCDARIVRPSAVDNSLRISGQKSTRRLQLTLGGRAGEVRRISKMNTRFWRVEYEASLSVLLTVSLRGLGRSKATQAWRRRSVAWTAGGFALGIGGAIAYSGLPWWLAVLSAGVGGLIASIAYLPIYDFIIRGRVTRLLIERFGRQPALPCAIEIRGEGLWVRQGESELTISWRDGESVDLTENGIELRFTQGGLVFAPLRSFTSVEHREEFYRHGLHSRDFSKPRVSMDHAGGPSG